MHRAERLEYLKSNRRYSDIREVQDEEDEQDEKLHFSEAARDSIQQRRDQKNKLQELVRQKNKAKSSYRDEDDDEFEDAHEEYADDREQKGTDNSKRSNQNATNGGPMAGQHLKPVKKVFDSFGQFFGPSQRVVAPRILEEEKARQEAERIAAREALQKKERLKEEKNRDPQGIADRRKPVGKEMAVPSSGRAENVQKRVKVRQLKAARDYSFLFEPDVGGAPQAHEPPQPRPSSSDTHLPSGDRTRNNGTPGPPQKPSQVRRDPPLARPPEKSKSMAQNGSRTQPANGNEIRRDRASQTGNVPKQRDLKGGASLMPKGKADVVHRHSGAVNGRKGGSDTVRELVSDRKIAREREKQGVRPVDKPVPRTEVPNGKAKLAPSAGGSTRPKSSENELPQSNQKRFVAVPKATPAPTTKAPVRTPVRAPVKPAPRAPEAQRRQALSMRPAENSEGRTQANRRQEAQRQRAPDREPPLKKVAIPRRREEVENDEEEDEYSHDSFLDDDEDLRGGGRSALSSVLGMFRRNYQENHRSRNYEDDSDDGAMEVGWDQVRREEGRSARVAREEDEREAALEEERERRRLEKKKKHRHG